MGAAHWFLLSALYWSASGLRLAPFEPTKKTQLAKELGAGSEEWQDHLSIGSATSLVACGNECLNKEFLIGKAALLLNGALSESDLKFNKDLKDNKDGGVKADGPRNIMYGSARMGIFPIGLWQPTKREPAWHRLHKTFVQEARGYTPAEPGQHKLVWFGDSIAEQMRGTDLGLKDHDGWGPVKAHLKNVSTVVQETYGKAYPDPLIFGIWADTTEQLWYRIEHGEISPAMAKDPGLVMNLLVTHKTFEMTGASKISKQIIACGRRLLQKTKGKLMIDAYTAVGSQMFNQMVTEKVNAEVEELTKTQLMKEFPGRVDFADCAEGSRSYMKKLQPEIVKLEWNEATNTFKGWAFPDNTGPIYFDGTHPNYIGHKQFADCLIPKLKQLETKEA